MSEKSSRDVNKISLEQKEAIEILIELVKEPRVPTNIKWDKILEKL